MERMVRVLCAVREGSAMYPLMRELDDGETCVFSTVSSGSQALRACERLSPDILVTDAVLPGLDGPALIDRIREMNGADSMRIIGGAMMPFAREAFAQRGVFRIVSVPWKSEELRAALVDAMEEIHSSINWEDVQEGAIRAGRLLERLGMHQGLRGFLYLTQAAALTAQDESRLYAIGKQIYTPIAKQAETTPQNVERLIRHAVESTMDSARAQELYAFFGNTIDPARGKPTNAQMIGMLSQKVRTGEKYGLQKPNPDV